MDTRTQSSAPGASPHPSPAPSSPPSAGAAAPDDAAEATPQGNVQRSREGQAAIARLGAPVRTRLRIGQALVLLSAILAVAPYIALVQLGDILLRAYRAGLSPDPQQVSGAVMVLVSAYSTRLLLYFLALLITHLADLSLRDRLRRVSPMRRCPGSLPPPPGACARPSRTTRPSSTPSSLTVPSSASTPSSPRWPCWAAPSGSTGAWPCWPSPHSSSTCSPTRCPCAA